MTEEKPVTEMVAVKCAVCGVVRMLRHRPDGRTSGMCQRCARARWGKWSLKR